MRERYLNLSVSPMAQSRDVLWLHFCSIYSTQPCYLMLSDITIKVSQSNTEQMVEFFNLQRLRAKTKVLNLLARDFLYADDCALAANTLEDAQEIVNCFATSASRFGRSINIKKTEVICQSRPNSSHSGGILHINNTPLVSVEKFCYLGSVLSRDATIDEDVTQRIAKASQAFGRLRHRLWSNHGVKLQTKINVYQAVVISTLLYGAEAWTHYRRHIKKLDQFHMRCLRAISNVKWQDRIPNTEVLERCRIHGIEAMVKRAQLRWAGHVRRMADSRLPKAIFYGQIALGERSRGRPLKRYKDCLKATLKECSIDPDTWENEALNRSSWRRMCHEGVEQFEERRIKAAMERRQKRKAGPSASGPFVCTVCGRHCAAQIGLISHLRKHRGD